MAGEPSDGIVAEIEKKITEAFEVFDRESNKTVDARNYRGEIAAAELSERKWLGAKYRLLSGPFELCVITKWDLTFFTTYTSDNILMLACIKIARYSSQQCQILQTLLGRLAYLSHITVLLDIGCVVRSLGCFPSESELNELLAKLGEEEEEEPTGFINLEKFLPVMTKLLLDRSYWPIPEDVLLHAFEALDENKCGYITKEDLVKYLTEEGEPFNQEEMEDMLSVALDPETNTLHYRDYLSKLVVDETKILPFNV